MKVLPKHIPNGEKYTENDLIAVNKKLKGQYKKEAIGWIGSLIGMFALGGILSAMGGVVGNGLAVICFIGAVPVSVLSARKPGKATFKEVSRLGIDGETWKAAIANCNEDKCAWGEPISKKIRYRFKCRSRKCKKVSDWFGYTFTSCSEELLAEKLERFKKLTKRGLFYENRNRIRGVVYSLERQCPFCGKKQPKRSPRWWTVLVTAAVEFVLMVLYILITASILDAMGIEYNQPIRKFLLEDFGIILFFLMLAVLIGSIIRCVRLRRKAAPEYDLS
ncbi:MAG: hypothetical protein IKX20_02145 [Paludibacteraceae bacterium]|nr:hypothetical protein [Paludibacteraceae bacterium]